ncbi:hypothetical protein GCM10009799_02840 [Nocardiopsis rhodophaea]|uniref:Uncharacterized protein n=1 Tax=Nocardiopsis rhodophaea TaxID=280238 RepID=A0ABN2S6A3_9ACTN
MTADEYPERPESERTSDELSDALFAADLKRLVGASQDNDDERTLEIRNLYLAD